MKSKDYIIIVCTAGAVLVASYTKSTLVTVIGGMLGTVLGIILANELREK